MLKFDGPSTKGAFSSSWGKQRIARRIGEKGVISKREIVVFGIGDYGAPNNRLFNFCSRRR